jgi:hypothetical protein
MLHTYGDYMYMLAIRFLGLTPSLTLIMHSHHALSHSLTHSLTHKSSCGVTQVLTLQQQLRSPVPRLPPHPFPPLAPAFHFHHLFVLTLRESERVSE